MTHQEVLEYYGTWTRGRLILGMGAQTFQLWRTRGYIPIQTQIAIERKAKTPKLVARVEDCEAQFDQPKFNHVATG